MYQASPDDSEEHNNSSKQQPQLQQQQSAGSSGLPAAGPTSAGGGGELSTAMDVFSLGCALAELFTDGTPPFDFTQLLAYRCLGSEILL